MSRPPRDAAPFPLAAALPAARTPASARLAGLLLALPLALVACSTTNPPRPDEVAVRVGGVGVDPRTQSPVLVLEESEGDRTLPIWIGFAEARSIAASLEGVEPPRPNTHDLAKRVIRELHAQLERVVVTELRNDTYYALLVLRLDRGQVEIDARPSDAIAIALRFAAPVFVRESLFETAAGGGPDEPGEPGSPEGSDEPSAGQRI